MGSDTGKDRGRTPEKGWVKGRRFGSCCDCLRSLESENSHLSEIKNKKQTEDSSKRSSLSTGILVLFSLYSCL